jgi:hypothetical protein
MKRHEEATMSGGKVPMSEPIVFITTLEIHEGKVGEFKEAAKRAMDFHEANGPHLFAGVYLDEAGRVANGVQVHRDSESILTTWKTADPYMREVMQHIRTTRVEIYGQPSEAVMEGMRRLAGAGASLVVRSRLAGFTRLRGGS